MSKVVVTVGEPMPTPSKNSLLKGPVTTVTNRESRLRQTAFPIDVVLHGSH